MLTEGAVLHSKYKVERKIGEGGMSTVWLAREISTSQIWAVKDINKKSKEFVAVANENGTLSEVEIVKDLNHPFIPHVNNVYEDSDSIQIVMEYVEGKTLKDILVKRGPIPEHLAVQIMKELIEVFIYLHTRPDPVIFRDLKPGNIMIQVDGHIRLIDFGIALLKRQNSKVLPLGTKGYAAPEQFKGKADARSDIYTMGATLYSLLTGIFPTTRDASFDDLLEKSPNTSTQLAKIVLKATQKDPDKRYHNVSELLKDLVTYNHHSFKKSFSIKIRRK